MKKLLIATAVATAAFGANAANVFVYGALDTGLVYQNAQGYDSTFSMESGNYAGPRFGLRGTEDLGSNIKVGFVLEAGFADDTGAMAKDGTLFNRESQLYLSGGWGTFGVGRVAAFTSGSSSLSWFWDMDPFETGYWDAGIQATQQNNWVLRSNTVYYSTPVMNGLKAGFQYSMNDETDAEATRWSDNNAFYNLALRWEGSAARIVGGVETTQMGNDTAEDDKYSVKLAAACTPENGPFTYYIGASWYKNYRQFAESTWLFDDRAVFAPTSGKGLEGYSGYLGLKYTSGKTDYLALAQYLIGENKGAVAGEETDYSRYVGSLGVHHHLSDRTMLYFIGSYANGDNLLKDTEAVTGHFGMTHFF